MDLISELLDERHVLTQFSCGNESLDRWLKESAIRGNVQDTGRTFVIHGGDQEVLGYYTLAAHALHRDSLALSKNKARSLPQELPAVLLAKLAVDGSLKDQGYGKDLLLEALEKCVDAAELVASRFVIVDAIDAPAAAFYEHFGFERIPGTNPVRLQRRISDIAADLGSED